MLDRIPVEEITRQAREVRPGVVVLTWVAAVLFAFGWVLHKVVAVVWLALAWSYVAAREGWRSAGSPKDPGVSRRSG
jgi:hypothetical protein